MTIDELIALYVKSWTGYRVDGQGFLVPTALSKDLKPLATKASSEAFTVKAYDPKSKQFIGGMANAKEVDRMNEVLDPVGLIQGPYNKNSVLLLQHNHSNPLGLVTTLMAKAVGVEFEAWVGDPGAAPLTEWQDNTRSLIAQRILKAVSVGFIPHKIKMPSYNDQGMIVDPATIEQWELLELSVVAVPCNAGSIFDLKTQQEKKTVKIDSVIYASFPSVGKDGRFKSTTPGGKAMDEELKQLLQKQTSVMTDIGTALNGLKDSQANLQKSIDGLGEHIKGKKPDPKDPVAEPDADDSKKKIEALEKSVATLTESVKGITESVELISKHIVSQHAA